MSKYNQSYRGIGDMLSMPEIQAEMLRRAEKVKALAEAAAPVYERGRHPGRYKGAFRVSSGVRRLPSRRAYARVTNDSPEALFVEFGNVNTPKHRTLGRALIDGAGD